VNAVWVSAAEPADIGSGVHDGTITDNGQIPAMTCSDLQPTRMSASRASLACNTPKLPEGLRAGPGRRSGYGGRHTAHNPSLAAPEWLPAADIRFVQ